MRYFIALAYHGKEYSGWQTQPNAVTVQEVLEKALSTLLNTPTAIVGAGRTDSGVHASGMIAHFDSNKAINIQQLTYKLNSFLPLDIAIHSIYKVKDDAHARFDATSRSYVYRISPEKNPFTINTAYYLQRELDIEVMNKACAILFEYIDFKCFSKSNTDVKTYLCTIKEAVWKKVDNELCFYITANRFLRNMVRAIVGTMIEIGLHKIPVTQLHAIIQSKNRSEAGYSVPAHGLYLTQVAYPKNIVIDEQ